MSIVARLEYIEGYFFFGSEDKLNPFEGCVKEPIFFSRCLKIEELREHNAAMRGPGIEDKSLYTALREKEDYVRQTQILSLIRSKYHTFLT
jgi:hypothetical protein